MSVFFISLVFWLYYCKPRAKLTDFDDVKAHLIGEMRNNVDCILQLFPVFEVKGIPPAVVFERATQALAS